MRCPCLASPPPPPWLPRSTPRCAAAGTPARAVKERAYLKSELVHRGVDVPTLRRIARGVVRAHRAMTHAELIALVEALWAEPVHERRAVAIELLVMRGDLLVAADLRLVERLIREARTWALVDGLAPAVAGPLIERFAELGRVLDRWAIDPDVWVRRAALLALLIPLREGRGDFDRFGRYADAMLDDRQVLIRKAIGWVLRETSKRRPDLITAWLTPRAARASGLTASGFGSRTTQLSKVAVRQPLSPLELHGATSDRHPS